MNFMFFLITIFRKSVGTTLGLDNDAILKICTNIPKAPLKSRFDFFLILFIYFGCIMRHVEGLVP